VRERGALPCCTRHLLCKDTRKLCPRVEDQTPYFAWSSAALVMPAHPGLQVAPAAANPLEHALSVSTAFSRAGASVQSHADHATAEIGRRGVSS